VGGGRGIGSVCGLDIVITEAGTKLSRRWRKPPDWTTGLRTFTADADTTD